MWAYFARRLLLILPTLVGVTLIGFMITRIVPGGPIEREILKFRMGSAGSGGATSSIIDNTQIIPESTLNQLKKDFNFDQPPHIAYWRWLKRLATFDLGKSYYKRRPVVELIVEKLPVSLTFGLTGFTLAYLICIPLGIAKALRHGTSFDFLSSAAVFVGYSIPGWALGVLLLLLLASGRFLDVMPLGDERTMSYDQLPGLVKALDSRESASDEDGQFQWERLSFTSRVLDRTYHMALPVACYMMGSFASLTVLMKNSLMENLGQDYVRTAFAKGLTPRRVIYLHTLRNSLIPLATGLGHAIGIIMAGSYLIEFVFNIDGVGYLGFTAIENRDYPVVMGILVINTLLLLIGNILSDLLYALIDPRIRFD